MKVMIVGVGGQGTLLASRVLGAVALDEGYDVKMSEVHGMAQRGGSVVTYVIYGDKVYSPVIEEGEADVVVSFEELEAYRWVSYLKRGGKLIVNSQKIDPMPVITGEAEYPKNIIEKIKGLGIDVTAVDALSVATEAGNKKSVNIVLMGIMAKHSGIDREKWMEAVRKTVKPQFVDVNLKAFQMGYDLA